MFTLSIIYSHHREFKNAFSLHRFESYHSCSCFFTSSKNILCQVRTLSVKQLYKISAVIYYNIRFMFKTHFKMPHVLFISSPMICEYFKASVRQCSCYIILGRQTIASCHRHMCTACRQYKTEISSFSLEMYRKTYFNSIKRPIPFKLFLHSPEQRHIVSHPLYFSVAGLCKCYISDIIFIHINILS